MRSPKTGRQVAWAAEPAFRSNARNRHAGHGQQLVRLLQAHTQNITMPRHAHGIFKNPPEVGTAHFGTRRLRILAEKTPWDAQLNRG